MVVLLIVAAALNLVMAAWWALAAFLSRRRHRKCATTERAAYGIAALEMCWRLRENGEPLDYVYESMARKAQDPTFSVYQHSFMLADTVLAEMPDTLEGMIDGNLFGPDS